MYLLLSLFKFFSRTCSWASSTMIEFGEVSGAMLFSSLLMTLSFSMARKHSFTCSCTSSFLVVMSTFSSTNWAQWSLPKSVFGYTFVDLCKRPFSRNTSGYFIKSSSNRRTLHVLMLASADFIWPRYICSLFLPAALASPTIKTFLVSWTSVSISFQMIPLLSSWLSCHSEVSLSWCSAGLKYSAHRMNSMFFTCLADTLKHKASPSAFRMRFSFNCL